jgi:ubiquinone/menaquinone biosynthesis C-methylase UbiE
MIEDYTQRFTGRAEAYSKYRPSYPKQVLNILEKEMSFDSSKIVADVGSGTGILSRLFLENGNRVFGVEPNDDMRSIAESSLARFQRFISIKGSAGNTTLEDRSVDLISVAQALHWFDPEKSWNEFKRITKQGGYLCILYNDRKIDSGSGIMKRYEEIIERYVRNKPKTERVENDNLSKFFSGWSFRKFSIPNEQTLEFEGLVGRVCSASYMPRQSEENFLEMKRELEDMFSKYQKDNKITLSYDTNIFLGLI